MAKSAAVTIEQLLSRLREQVEETTKIHAILEIQFTRIAQMQAELDALPQARRRRDTLRALLPEVRPQNGNHGHH